MLKIGEFANLFNISIKTVRFYEEKNLFKPFYIDKYSGYRYYDEKNIYEMSKILYLKELDFSLDEIKNCDENLVNSKIEQYKEKIIKLRSNINILENFEIDFDNKTQIKPFINDKQAIGKWNLIGISNTEEEAVKQEFDNTIKFDFKQLYFLEKGKKYWVISWTKNIVYIKGRENPYEIKGNTMYVKILYPDDNSLYMVAVYEKENSKIYTIDEIRKKDKFSGYYKKDYNIMGFWKTVDFLVKKESFNYKRLQKEMEKDYKIRGLIINPEDNTIMIKNKNNNYILSKYTKGYLFNLQTDNTLSQYIYKKVNKREFIIVESKTEDYVYGKGIEGYYVLEKIGGNFMEKMFESKSKIYSILNNGEKKGLVLGKEIYLPEDKRGNINTLVVGGSGSGKTSCYIIPNILNMLGSYIVTDFFGEIYEKTHEYLEKNGYETIKINYGQGLKDYKYNPLNYIANDDDVEILADILCNMLKEKDTDEFWNEAAKILIKCVLYYVLEKEEKKDLLTCFKIISLEKNDFFEKLNCFEENSKKSEYYAILKSFPEKTYKSIASTALMKLSFVINTIPDDRIFDRKIDFNDLSKKKMAIFIEYAENLNDYKKLANVFLSQFLSQISIHGEKKEKIYLLLNEVDLLGEIYNFSRQIELTRAKGISINIIINNLKRFEKIYEDDFYNILNHIDTQCLLGTNLKVDIEYFSDLLGIDTSFIKDDLDNDKLLIYEKGLGPILAEKDYYFNK